MRRYPARMARSFSRTVLALALLAPGLAAAWGPQGHRLVADVAWQQLPPATRAQVDALLQGEPEPTLAGVANWADQLREHDPELGRRSSGWHYVNLGEHECGYEAARDCRGGNCVVEAIGAQAAILADRTQPVAARAQALKFVVHFVGDVHQPLHAGFARDKGGNTVQVRIPDGSPEGQGGNLHRLWDSGLLNTARRDDDAYLAHLQAQSLVIPDAAALPPAAAQWAQQSCAIVLRPGFYPAVPQIGADYVQAWLPLAEEQVHRAGLELARVLAAALPAD